MNTGTPDMSFSLSPTAGADASGNIINNQLFGNYISTEQLTGYPFQQYQQPQQQHQQPINQQKSSQQNQYTTTVQTNQNYITTPVNGYSSKSSADNSPDRSNSNVGVLTPATTTDPASNSVNGSTNGAAANPNAGISEEELYQRRKAQNRAAQRAFRERKEGKLKELSSKLQEAEVSREKLEKQLNDLKEKNIMLDMENQMLQKQNAQQALQNQQNSTFESSTIDLNKSPYPSNNGKSSLGYNEILSFKFPNTSKCDFIDGTIDWAAHGRSNETSLYANKIGESYNHDNEKVLTISAIWDYLVEFSNLNEDYSIDIPGIMNELRGKEVCHGFGPAYPLVLVNEIILKYIENDS